MSVVHGPVDDPHRARVADELELGHLALETVWDAVIVEKVAAPAELLGDGSAQPRPAPSPKADDTSSPSSARSSGNNNNNNKLRKRKKTVVGPVSALKPQPSAPPKAPPTPAKPQPPAVKDEPEELEVVPWKLDALHELMLREDCSEGRSLAALFIAREYLRKGPA